MTRYSYLTTVVGLALAGLAQAGDRFHGYDSLAGKWRAEPCPVPGLSITLTESRANAVNVYELNDAGKKVQLRVSTSPMLARQGRLKRVGDALAGKTLRIETRTDAEEAVTVTLFAADDGRLHYKELAAGASRLPLIDCRFRRW